MAKKYWLFKSEPTCFSMDDLKAMPKETDHWDGVRNYQARNNLKLICKGDIAFIYHSVGPKEIVGTAVATKTHYQDPTDSTGQWVVIDLKPHQSFKVPVTLEKVKSDTILRETALVKQSRLSVMPVTAGQAKRIQTLSR